MKLKAYIILLFLVVVLSNRLASQVINGELNPCPGVDYTYIFSGPSFNNYFLWSVVDGTIVSQNSSTVVVRWNNNITENGKWRLRVQYETIGLGGTSGGSTYIDLNVKVNVATRYAINGDKDIPGDYVGTKTYTATPNNPNFPATSFLWTTNTGIQTTTTNPSFILDMRDKQIRWIGVAGKTSACSGWGEMSKIDIFFKAIITGPSQLCSEEIYTITNPGIVALEDAMGIATLTYLGNEKWKVTRIGNAEGKVILKSSAGNGITVKYIQIGRESYQISGYDAIGYDGGIYSFSVQEVHGNTYSWSFSNLPTGATVQGNTTNVVRVLMPQRTSSDPTGGKITVNLTINTLCGPISTSKQITYGTAPKPPGGGGLDPDPVLP